MRSLKLTLAYDGTDFAGWQRQSRDRTVQAVVEDALTRIDGVPVSVVGAGRTDAGVHALGQVASAVVANDLDPPTLRRALNANLPEDVRVMQVDIAPDGFDARRGARRKTYEYWIVTGEVASPFDRRFAWHVPHPLDVAAMQGAAGLLAGDHDFASFQSTGSSVASTRREIYQSEIIMSPTRSPDRDIARSPDIVYRVTGSGFLRHMVRAIVGTLVEVGVGRRARQSIAALLTAGDRGAAGPTAPAHGLWLVQVEYE